MTAYTHEENHNAPTDGPAFGHADTEPTISQPCPTCGHIAETGPERAPIPSGPPVKDLVPDAAAIKTAFRTLVLLMEVLDGRRPWRQVAHLAVPGVGRYLRAAPVAPRATGRPARVVSFHPSQPHRCRIETASSLDVRGWRRALGRHLPDHRRREWICTMIRIL